MTDLFDYIYVFSISFVVIILFVFWAKLAAVVWTGPIPDWAVLLLYNISL